VIRIGLAAPVLSHLMAIHPGRRYDFWWLFR